MECGEHDQYQGKKKDVHRAYFLGLRPFGFFTPLAERASGGVGTLRIPLSACSRLTP